MNSLPIEITELISNYLPYIDDVLHLKATCKYAYENLSLHMGTEESNTEVCIRMYRTELEYSKLSPNNFSPRFISKNMDKPWNPMRLSRYKKLTDDIVKNNKDFRWVYPLVWGNPSISFEFAYTLFQQYSVRKQRFYHPDITTDFILSTPISELNWRKLTKCIDVDFILSHPHLPWEINTALGKNPTLRLRHILAHPNIDIDYTYVTDPDIIIHMIKNCPNKVRNNGKFITYAILHRPKLILSLPKHNIITSRISRLALTNEEFFLQNIDRNIWNFQIISEYIDSSNFHIVANHPDKNWNWRIISYRVTWDIVVNYPNCPWVYDTLSANRHVTLHIIEHNPERPWSYLGLSFNPNLTFEYVREHKDKFRPYMKYVSVNPGIKLSTINFHPKFGWKWNYVSLRLSINIMDTYKYPNIKWNVKYIADRDDIKRIRYKQLIVKGLLNPTDISD